MFRCAQPSRLALLRKGLALPVTPVVLPEFDDRGAQARTVEARVLRFHPEVRRRVAESPEFAAWRAGLRSVDVDGETLYLRGGDMLRDEDQIIFEWARRQGWLPDDAIERARVAGPDA